MHRWTSTVEEERVCLHRCVIDRRVYAASLSDAVALLLPSLYNDACDRELGHVLRLTHMHVTLRCDRMRGESSRSSLVRMHRPRSVDQLPLFFDIIR